MTLAPLISSDSHLIEPPDLGGHSTPDEDRVGVSCGKYVRARDRSALSRIAIEAIVAICIECPPG